MAEQAQKAAMAAAAIAAAGPAKGKSGAPTVDEDDEVCTHTRAPLLQQRQQR
jgi:hypothetical protein